MSRTRPNGGDTRRVWLQPSCRLAALVLALATGLASCGEQTPAEGPAAGNTPARAGGARPFNIRDVFPAGPGRQLVLDNCQSCHVLVPILVLRMDSAAWHRNGIEHRERVEGLNDDEFELLYDYLASTFTPDRPIPELPAALLDTWTTY